MDFRGNVYGLVVEKVRTTFVKSEVILYILTITITIPQRYDETPRRASVRVDFRGSVVPFPVLSAFPGVSGCIREQYVTIF